MKRLMTRFARDTGGNIAMVTGLSMTTVILGVAAAFDYSLVSNTRSDAQTLSDSLALAAAVTVGDIGLEEARKSARFSEGKVYTAEDLDLNLGNLVEGSEVSITFEYDEEEHEVKTTIWGKNRTSVMSIAGVDYIDFSVETVTEFPGDEMKYPASIAMVIDNSNSMWYDTEPSAPWNQVHFDTQYNNYRRNNNWSTAVALSRQVPTGLESRPPGAVKRIDSLRSAFQSLNDTLYESVGGKDDQRFLRMGLIPFNHNFISGKSSSMNWGVIPQSKIDGMDPSGETDTSRGMDKARDWLRNEPSKYSTETRPNLKRYVIFMTDGHNTKNRTEQIDKPGSGLWRGQVERSREGRWRTRRSCTRHETRYRNTGEGGTQSYRACVQRGPEERYWQNGGSWWSWTNKRQATRPTEGRGWKEIDYVDRTRRRCDEFREQGIDVFSVAYALQPGVYQRNLPGRPPKEYWGVSPDEVDEARELLEYCATTSDHVLSANDAKSLREAFEEIGLQIADDTMIRIKS